MRRHTTLLLLFMLALSSVSFSQEIDEAKVFEKQINVPRVLVQYKGGYDPQGTALEGSSSNGTGTYLGDRLLLTCAHNVRKDPGDGTLIRILISFHSGEKINAKVLKVDKIFDQALLELDTAPTSCKGIRLASKDPKVGDRVVYGGYGSRKSLNLSKSTVLSLGSPDGIAYTERWFDVYGNAPRGDSGGPIFNADVELIGNLWGSDGKGTTGIITSQTRKFLTQYMQRLDSCWGTSQSQFGSQYSQQPSLQRSPNSPQYRQPTPPSLSTRPTTPVAPPVRQPEARSYVSIDYSRLAIEISKSEGFQDFLKTTVDFKGQDADCSEVIVLIQNLQKQVEQLKNQPVPTPDPVADWTHLILIAPSTAEYWPRLKDDLARAQDYYSHLRHVEAPTDRDIGPMPLLVAYTNGKPTSFRRVGYESVSHALYQITNGQFDMKTNGESN